MVNVTMKKQQIEEIAFDLFLTKGYEATTVRMICKKAGIEPPTMYYYFGSKKGLFFSVVESMLCDYQKIKKEREIEQIIEPIEMLRTIYEYSIHYAIKHTKETKFYIRYTLFTPSELKKEIEEYMRNTYEKKIKLYKDCLLAIYEISEFKFDIDKTYKKFEMLVNDSTFNVVFSEWRPTQEEIYGIFDTFFKLLLMGIPLKC